MVPSNNLKIKNYVSLQKALTILEINVPLESVNNRRDARVILLGLKIKEKSINRKPCYLLNDILVALTKADSFFEKYYVTEEIIEIPEIIRSTFESEPIPTSYNYVRYSNRFPNQNYKRFKVGYKKSDADLYRNNKNDEKNGFIPLSDAISILQLADVDYDDHRRRRAIKKFKSLGVEIKLINNTAFCNKDSVIRAYNKVKSFFEEYCVIDDIPLSKGSIYYLIEKRIFNPINFPLEYTNILLKARGNNEVCYYKKAFLRAEVDEYIYKSQSLNQDILNNINDYIEFDDAIKITNFSINHFKKVIIPKYNLTIHPVDNKQLISKKPIFEIVEHQENFYKEYIDSYCAAKTYLINFDKHRYNKKLPTYQAPPFAYTKDRYQAITTKKGVYKISDILDFLRAEELRIDIISTDIIGDTNFNTFIQRLNQLKAWSGFNEDSKYTEHYWFEYVKDSLKNTRAKGKALHYHINCYIKCTVLIKDILFRNNKTEIYMFKASEINLFLRTIDGRTKELFIYRFIKFVYEEILYSTNSPKRIFRIDDVVHPNKRKQGMGADSKKDVIYTFEEYSLIFQYVLNLELHTFNSINEIEKNKKCIYASTWLYVILHLNNAWRHGDVKDFPRIEIQDLLNKYEIQSISWFKNKTIGLTLAREIVERVRQWEFVISKTEMKGRFFCSDELAIPFATSVIILSLFNIENQTYLSEILMHFYTKHNDVSKYQLKTFLKDLNDFNFTSKKLNKTVMTYIVYLSNLSGDTKAIEYAKWIRSHVSIDSTLHYIDFDIETVENLSKMLFARGEFGYVSSLLLSKLNKNENYDFYNTTEQIVILNKLFGNSSKLNSTIAFLNTIRSEREKVRMYISQLSFEQCQKLFFDLYARKLPSKIGDDPQCLFGRTLCQRPNIDDCFDCQFHIPNIYALSSLCESLKKDFIKFNSSSRYLANRLKIALNIHKKKLVLLEAIQKFGQEYVLSCINMTLDELIDNLSEIPDILNLTKKGSDNV